MFMMKKHQQKQKGNSFNKLNCQIFISNKNVWAVLHCEQIHSF